MHASMQAWNGAGVFVWWKMSVQERRSAGETMQFAVPVVLRLCDDGSNATNRGGWEVEREGRTVRY